MHAESAGKVSAAPNVTPMIDVMLVLLCIFMIVTPTLLNGPVADPPRAENLLPRPELQTDHTLAIDITGALYLDKRPISVANLKEALTTLYPTGVEDRVLYVRAHRDLPYGTVRDALEIARMSGVVVAGLVSEKRD